MDSTSALWSSIVRTVVPLIGGGIITWLVSLGIDLDSELRGALDTVLYAAFTALYYIGVRLLETYVAPRFGWLLGLAKAPQQYTGKHSA